MDHNPATLSNDGHQSNAGNYYAKFKKEKGNLDFETLSKNNELYFADKGASFYVNTNESFAPKMFDKYDKRQDGKLQIGDSAPNCKVQLLPCNENKSEDDQQSEYKYIFDFCSNSRPMVLSFGSFS